MEPEMELGAVLRVQPLRAEAVAVTVEREARALVLAEPAVALMIRPPIQLSEDQREAQETEVWAMWVAMEEE
jgi:hypothetical protein